MSLKIGALFDWDGVIGDSAECHERSWVKLADSRNLFLPKDAFKITFGRRNVEIITEVLKWTDDLNEAQELSDAKEIIYRRLCETEGLPTIAGAVEFIKGLKSANIPCVVGSSAPRANLEVAIKVLGLEDYFAAVVASEDVPVGKPAPDVYLRAAAEIGVSPEHCAVFEDSLPGIISAGRAGSKKIALATTHDFDFWKSRKILEETPDIIIKDFTKFSPHALRALFA